MSRKRYRAEQIKVKLREAEFLEAKGKSLGEISKVIVTVQQTLIRWLKKYGGLRLEQEKRFKEFQKENINSHDLAKHDDMLRNLFHLYHKQTREIPNLESIYPQVYQKTDLMYVVKRICTKMVFYLKIHLVYSPSVKIFQVKVKRPMF